MPMRNRTTLLITTTRTTTTLITTTVTWATDTIPTHTAMAPTPSNTPSRPIIPPLMRTTPPVTHNTRCINRIVLWGLRLTQRRLRRLWPILTRDEAVIPTTTQPGKIYRCRHWDRGTIPLGEVRSMRDKRQTMRYKVPLIPLRVTAVSPVAVKINRPGILHRQVTTKTAKLINVMYS